MQDFITNCILWTFALYGLIEIIKNFIYIHSCNKIHTEGINLIIAVKNQENEIEGFLRTLNFRLIYGKENCIENIILLDLNSSDNTRKIIENFAKDYPNIQLLKWNEFEEIFCP